MRNVRSEYFRHKDLEDSLQIAAWSSVWKNIWHYHRKSLLPGEISVPSASKVGFRSIVSGILGMIALVLQLLRTGHVLFRLNRANLRNPQIEGLREVLLDEKGRGGVTPDILAAGYLIRGVLRIVLAPFAVFEARRLNRNLAEHSMAPVRMSTACAALGDRAFCQALVLLKTRGGLRRNDKVYFCAAVVPDAHLYACASGFVEVAHGVIHLGHPSLFNLARAQTPFVVPDARTREICIDNSAEGKYIVDMRFFKTFFVHAPQGPRVFVGQPGEPFEAIATRFLANFPEWRVRPHPRSSTKFIEVHRAKIVTTAEVSEVASVSSTMLNDATQLAIPLTVVRSSIDAENEKLETSFEGLLLPSSYNIVHV